MGFLIFFPIILPILAAMAIWEALVILSLAFLVLSVASALHSAALAFVLAPQMMKSKRAWVRVIGAVLVTVAAIATLAFIVGAIFFAVLAIFF